MVKIAIAGGSGNVAKGIVKALAATQKHEILILSRREPAEDDNGSDIKWVKADYGDKKQLASVLNGVHTVLSFVGGTQDPGSVIQKNLIDAAISAGVQRFAPSEWSSSSTEELPWYAEKDTIRAYLKEINQEKKICPSQGSQIHVLEYTLFQPGMLLDYLAPSGTTIFESSQELWIDFHRRRAITLEGIPGYFSCICGDDLANVVVQAIEYKGVWPTIGGIHGTTISDAELIQIGEKVQNKKFDTTTLKEEDVRTENIKSPWIPKFEDPSFSSEKNEYFSKLILKGCLLSGLSRSWVVSDEWNRLLPNFKSESAEEFLTKKWAGNVQASTASRNI